MKIGCLDLGDAWTGVALSDVTQTVARPYTTLPTAQLYTELARIIEKERLGSCIVGLPITLSGKKSEQTKKVELEIQQLSTRLPIPFIPWDERLSSKQAEAFKKAKTKEEKIKSHALAAAFILQSYLDYKNAQKNIFTE